MRTVGMGVTKVFDIFGKVTKKENIILPDLASNFDLHYS